MAQTFGDRWQVIESLSEGGQAHTLLARDLKDLGPSVYVIKKLKNVKRIARFQKEVDVVSRLTHDNIVRLVASDLEGAKPYAVFEHCSGGDLVQAMSESPFDIQCSFQIFDEVCAGLEYAHANGVVHRDIKPQNILLRTPSGPAIIADFGICFADVDDHNRLTETCEAVGPRLYMAPELEDGRTDNISEYNDVYSLGKLLYWMLSGGGVFAREQHRTVDWDLKGRNANSVYGWNNLYMEHANVLLDLMITADMSKRRPVDNIRILARRTARLILDQYNPINNTVPQPCNYCGQGQNILRNRDNITDVQNFGLQAIGANDWRILVCNFCGHVEFFRLDLGARPSPWR